MKILINRKPVDGPWGGGNLFVKAFCELLREKGHTVVHELSSDLDVIFMQDPRYSELGISINEIASYKRQKPSTLVLHRVNECDARKGTEDMDQLLQASSEYVDTTIFVSNWMKNYHMSRGWKCSDARVLYNGVEKRHFQPREKSSKIDNGKINLVTHHWSNNRMKGFDVYEALDEFVGKNNDFTFTYIGRALDTFKNTELVKPTFGADLGEKLSMFDVYISGSLFDPGPNHILESLACEIPTYAYKDGGGACEFVGESHTYNSIEELTNILLGKKFKINDLMPDDWETCIDGYYRVLVESFYKHSPS